jgi:anti-sigma factor RsiW
MNREFDAELAMRYADGMTDPAETARVEAELAGNPDLADYVRAMRDSASLARGALNEVLHEAVPQRLLDAVMADPKIDDETLMAWCDGELDKAASARVAAAIAKDSKLAARAAIFRRTGELARGALASVVNEPVPQRLIDAINATPASARILTFAPRGQTNAAPSRNHRGALGWAVAASILVLAMLGAGGVVTGRIEPPTGLQLVAADTDRWLDNVAGAYDIYAGTKESEGRLLVDFTAEDVPQLAKRFGANLNRNLAIPDLAPLGFELQGGRMVVVGGRPGAQLLYTNAAGELVGLSIAFSRSKDREARIDKRGDVNLVHWHRNGYGYAFSGRIEPARLKALADQAGNDLAAI